MFRKKKLLQIIKSQYERISMLENALSELGNPCVGCNNAIDITNLRDMEVKYCRGRLCKGKFKMVCDSRESEEI